MSDYCPICEPNGTIQAQWLSDGRPAGWATVDNGTLRFYDALDNLIELPIWHCPYCGRKLYEEE